MKRAITEGWVDTTLPDLADLLPAGFDLQWLGSQLGRYRASELDRQTTPKRREEQRFLTQLADALGLAHQLLDHEELPPHADGTTEALAHAVGADWPALRKRLRADLEEARGLVQMCAAKLVPGKDGTPPKTARNDLQRALVDRLRQTPMKADPARIIAEQVLTRCGIDVPLIKDGDTRAIRRTERGKN